MKFSLIGVNKQRNNRVDGNWIQDHIGTLDTATKRARETEAANGNKITVAVVDEVAGTQAILCSFSDLIRLDM